MRVSLLTWIMFSTLATAVQGAPDYPTKDVTLHLLESNQFDELNARYGKIQAAYRSGAITEIDLRDAFRNFYATDAALEEHYQAWVNQSPKSYVAHLARGIYYKFLGNERRGEHFASETSTAQFEAMSAAHQIAADELQTSLALEHKPILSYLHAMDARRSSSDTEAVRALYDQGIAIAPKSLLLRMKYMASLQTRWGGSVEEMQAFLAECRSAHLTAENMNSLESLVVEDEGWVLEYRDHDTKGAIAKYREAGELDDERSCEICGPTFKAAALSRAAKDYPVAIEIYSKALERHPNLIIALNGRGYCYSHIYKESLAAADWLKSAELGDAYGQTETANRILFHAPSQTDRAVAIAWLEKAAAQGYQPAQKRLAAERAGIPPGPNTTP